MWLLRAATAAAAAVGREPFASMRLWTTCAHEFSQSYIHTTELNQNEMDTISVLPRKCNHMSTGHSQQCHSTSGHLIRQFELASKPKRNCIFGFGLFGHSNSSAARSKMAISSQCGGHLIRGATCPFRGGIDENQMHRHRSAWRCQGLSSSWLSRGFPARRAAINHRNRHDTLFVWII